MFHAYIEEDCISVGITIVPVNAIKSLRELDIANLPSNLGVHQETHGLSRSLAVVHIMVTIQVEHERSIGKHSRDTNLLLPRIHGTILIGQPNQTEEKERFN